jgi:hypothetical protein
MALSRYAVGMRDEPAHDFRAFLDRAEPAGASPMAGIHIGLEQELKRLDNGCVLHPFLVHDGQP